ncbi:hypothetical protein Trydic_g13240 [Trypoxylus dichotomus]
MFTRKLHKEFCGIGLSKQSSTICKHIQEFKPKGIVKHGSKSVMAWGAIGAAGPCVDSFGLERDWIFQQDNDSKHTARLVKDWLLLTGYAPRQLCSSGIIGPKIDHAASKSKESLKKTLIPG